MGAILLLLTGLAAGVFQGFTVAAIDGFSHLGGVGMGVLVGATLRLSGPPGRGVGSSQ